VGVSAHNGKRGKARKRKCGQKKIVQVGGQAMVKRKTSLHEKKTENFPYKKNVWDQFEESKKIRGGGAGHQLDPHIT